MKSNIRNNDTAYRNIPGCRVRSIYEKSAVSESTQIAVRLCCRSDGGSIGVEFAAAVDRLFFTHG